jgi:hypothetical protein
MISRPVKPPFAHAINRGNPLARGLVGAWAMTEGSGDTVYDLSGYGNHGSLLGWAANTAFRGGPHGWCVDFNEGAVGGADVRISAGSAPSLDDLTAFTYMASIYPKSSGEGAAGRIFNKNAKNLNTNGTQIVGAVNRATTNATATSTATVANNAWQTVGMAYTEADGLRLYRGAEGGRLDEMAYSARAAGSGATSTDAADTLFLGNRSDLARTFDGYFNWAFVWNRDLTLEEQRRIHEDPYSLISAERNLALWPASGGGGGGGSAARIILQHQGLFVGSYQ